MSRVGKSPIQIPDGVNIAVNDNNIEVAGKLGKLSMVIDSAINVEIKDKVITVSPKSLIRHARSMWGTTRNRIQNMITGVQTGFTKTLEMTGVGYRSNVEGNKLKLELGFSHDIFYPIPEGINIQCPKPTQIEISGYDKQRVGQVAAEIRSYRGPEPYKGKGVRYSDEVILRKEGKKK